MKKVLLVLFMVLFVQVGFVCGQDDAASEGLGTEIGTDSVGDTGEGTGENKPGPGLPDMILPMVLMFAVLYLFMFRGPKKKQKERQQMLSAMKKSDRVVTIGGIIGTLVEVREDEVTLKIDEASNTKIRMSPNAISKVLTDNEDAKT